VFIFNDQLKDLLNADDVVPEAYETVSLTDKNKFRSFIKTLEHIKKTDTDNKVKAALDYVVFALNSGKNPIVFCQYIQTAEYVGKYISEHLKDNKKKIQS
jgi:ERCC4-related helicase